MESVLFPSTAEKSLHLHRTTAVEPAFASARTGREPDRDSFNMLLETQYPDGGLRAWLVVLGVRFRST